LDDAVVAVSLGERGSSSGSDGTYKVIGHEIPASEPQEVFSMFMRLAGKKRRRS